MLKRIIFLALAILAAGGTFIMVQGAKSTSPSVQTVEVQAPKKQGPMVLVAAKTMPAGSFVSPENFKWQIWPEGALSAAYIQKEKSNLDDYNGAVIRRGIVKGEPITLERMIKPGDRGFVAAILKQGMRAVSVNVNAMTGISGLVFPGDYVDVILTHGIRQLDDEERPIRQVSETILQKVRVLAMDQSTDDQNAKPAVPKTATLEVSPKQAEILMVAIELGRLSLSLRSLSSGDDMADHKPSEPSKTTDEAVLKVAKAQDNANPTFTLDGEASRLLSKDLGPKKITVFRGSEKQDVIVGRD